MAAARSSANAFRSTGPPSQLGTSVRGKLQVNQGRFVVIVARRPGALGSTVSSISRADRRVASASAGRPVASADDAQAPEVERQVVSVNAGLPDARGPAPRTIPGTCARTSAARSIWPSACEQDDPARSGSSPEVPVTCPARLLANQPVQVIERLLKSLGRFGGPSDVNVETARLK